MNTETDPTPDKPASRGHRLPWPEPSLAAGMSGAELVYALQSTALVCVLSPRAGASRRAVARLCWGFVEQARQRGLVHWRIEGMMALCGDERELGQDDRDALMLWSAHQPDLGALFLGEAAPMHELLGAKCPSGWDELLEEPHAAKRIVSVLLTNLIYRRRAQRLSRAAATRQGSGTGSGPA